MEACFAIGTATPRGLDPWKIALANTGTREKASGEGRGLSRRDPDGGCYAAACREAEAKLKAMTSKKGQRGLGWYDQFAALMVEAAQGLGIPVKTGGDRASDEPDKTPFTVFAFALERSLPKEAEALSLSACAKRLRRSLAKRQNRTE
jgi:hypothetical protein